MQSNILKKGHSIAIMIDQRVSEGEKINLFNKPALTTTLYQHNCLLNII